MSNKKYLKPIIFVASAVLVALILSLIFTKFADTYKTNGSTNIENQKNSILIGDKTIQEIVGSNENNEETNVNQNYENNENVQSPNINSSTNNDLAVDFIETIVSSNESESNKSEVFTDDYVIPKEVVEQLEETGIKEIDAYFLKDIVMISDSIVSNYSETLSYALTAEFDKGLESLVYLEENIKDLENIEVSDSNLKKVRDYLKKGTQYYIDGFKDYFAYGDDSEELFKSADTNFYNAQTTLQSYLDSFREE